MIARPPRTCSRSCTTSCGDSRRRAWPLNRPATLSSQLPLVHEAYLRLVGRAGDNRWDGRGHFFAAAAEAMRRILVEAARRKHGPERGGDFIRHDLNPDLPEPPSSSPRLLALDEALDRLAAVEPRAAEVVKLRYFVGLSVAEAAAALGISPRTADADWAYARAWLVTALRNEH